MTWIEVLPASAIILGLGCGLFGSIMANQRCQYRGILDKRVPYGNYTSRFDHHGRLKERDSRLSLYPTEVKWIHPLWRPSNFQENN